MEWKEIFNVIAETDNQVLYIGFFIVFVLDFLYFKRQGGLKKIIQDLGKVDLIKMQENINFLLKENEDRKSKNKYFEDQLNKIFEMLNTFHLQNTENSRNFEIYADSVKNLISNQKKTEIQAEYGTFIIGFKRGINKLLADIIDIKKVKDNDVIDKLHDFKRTVIDFTKYVYEEAYSTRDHAGSFNFNPQQARNEFYSNIPTSIDYIDFEDDIDQFILEINKLSKSKKNGKTLTILSEKIIKFTEKVTYKLIK